MRYSIRFSIVAFAFLLFMNHASFSQACPECRYISPQFDSVTVETVKFGEGLRANGNMQELFMDIYQPYGDTASNRAVAIFAFGGAFVTGKRNDWYVVLACEELAKSGYVVASIDYRIYDDAGQLASEVATGLITTGIPYHMRIFFRPMQDMRASVQYLKAQYAEMGNTYRIDTSKILIGGASSGAITSMMVAYCDKESEIAELGGGSTAPLDALGGFYSTTGFYPNYNWNALATFNVAGALLSPNWMEPGDIPVISAHGDADQVVPYKEGSFAGLTFGLFNMYGSYIVDSAARANGVCSYLYNMEGQDHPSTSLGIEYIKSVVYRLMMRMHAVLNDRSFCCDLKLHVNPVDTLYYEPNSDPVCLTACAVNHNGNPQYQWCGFKCVSNGGSSPSLTAEPDTNLNYLVAIAHEGNCQDVTLNMVVEGNPLDCDTPTACLSSSIQSFTESETSILVYPQPASDEIVLQTEFHATMQNRITIDIFDLAGRMVFSRNVFADRFMKETIDVKNWTSGCYLLRLSSAGANQYRKVIVQSSL